MPATPAQVKACSLTGEFDAIADAKIEPFVAEAADHYVDLPKRPVRQSVIDRLVALHAAHRLSQAKKLEGGEGEGGGEGLPGNVKSASLERIGSWTFGSSGADAQAAKDGKLPIDDWTDTPYGRRWRGLWGGIPTGTTNTQRP